MNRAGGMVEELVGKVTNYVMKKNFDSNSDQSTPEKKWLNQRSDGLKTHEGGVGSGDSIFSNFLQTKESRSWNLPNLVTLKSEE